MEALKPRLQLYLPISALQNPLAPPTSPHHYLTLTVFTLLCFSLIILDLSVLLSRRVSLRSMINYFPSPSEHLSSCSVQNNI